MVVAGGMSVAKNSNIAGIAHITNVTNSTASNNGALIVDGGVGIVKDLHIGGNIVCAGLISSADTNLYQEFHSYNLQGSRGSASGTITLNQSQNSTNYMVFPSFYYRYSRSGGTYSATDSSSAYCNLTYNHNIIYMGYRKGHGK
jgi:hypothetical protein